MKILVPTDLSENAKNALDFAIGYAKLQGASITLLYIYYAVYDYAYRAEELMSAIESDAKKALQKEIEAKGDEVSIDYKIIQGTIPTAINDTVLSGDYDLIIMGTQGASGIKKVLIGSNTANTIKESEVPVLAIPSGASFDQVQSITVAVELSNEDELLLAKVSGLTENLNLPYTILHVENKEDFNREISFKGLKAYLSETFPDDEFGFVKIQSPEFDKGAEEYLTSQSNTLFVMLSKNRNFFEALFTKSNSVKFAYHTHVPLLVVK